MLGIPALDGEASKTWSVIRRRLTLLRIASRITFDGKRAVVDVYGVDPAGVGHLAAELAAPRVPGLLGPSGHALPLDDAEISRVGTMRPGCGCKAIVRVHVPFRLEALASPPSDMASDGAPLTPTTLADAPLLDGDRATGLVVSRADVEWRRVEDARRWEAVALVVYLAPEADLPSYLLALGGGKHLGPVTVESVEVASAAGARAR